MLFIRFCYMRETWFKLEIVKANHTNKILVSSFAQWAQQAPSHYFLLTTYQLNNWAGTSCNWVCIVYCDYLCVCVCVIELLH